MNTSDRWAFGQVFLRQEYGRVPPDLEPELIIDCGANVGYTSIYFLTRFPDAKVIAIEPDGKNYEILEKNLTPYRPRARAIRAAIWSEPASLKLCRRPDQPRGEWSSYARPCRPEEKPDVAALDLGTILDDSGFERIDILKIDIEGAEIPVFSMNYANWLGRTDMILIELHSQEAAEVFYRALAESAMEFSQLGEVTIATRSQGSVQ